MNVRAHPTLLVGITARMLAELATRAGYPVVSVDYFGDADLRRLCPGVSLRHDRGTVYKAAALVDAAAELDAPYVVYAASLENHPDEVRRLATRRTLLGNPPETLVRVRDPGQLAAALEAGGFCFPRTALAPPEMAGDWVWKPLRSGGGHGVRIWRGEPPTEEGIFQERLEGMVGSAAFVADGRQALLVGLTEQLIGEPAFGASDFRYCGNLMPPRLPPAEQQRLLEEVRAIVNHLALAFGVRGLNGLDFIWHRERVWTIELNPRPTAPMELMERAYGLELFDAHVRSFSGTLPPFNLEEVLQDGPAAGKAVLFATEDITVADMTLWSACELRDIPHPGERIDRGHPICTLLTLSESPEQCKWRMEQQAAELLVWLKKQAGALPAQTEVATYG